MGNSSQSNATDFGLRHLFIHSGINENMFDLIRCNVNIIDRLDLCWTDICSPRKAAVGQRCQEGAKCSQKGLRHLGDDSDDEISDTSDLMLAWHHH